MVLNTIPWKRRYRTNSLKIRLLTIDRKAHCKVESTNQTRIFNSGINFNCKVLGNIQQIGIISSKIRIRDSRRIILTARE